MGLNLLNILKYTFKATYIQSYEGGQFPGHILLTKRTAVVYTA